MTRECHVRFCERLRGKLLRPTYHFGMKAHIAVDADSGLVHTVTTTAANEADGEQIADLLHGKERDVWADSGYRGAQARVAREDLQWHIASRPSDIAKLPDGRRKAAARKHEHRKAAARKHEHRKASVRAKVEHPFRVIKRQFGLAKVRFRGLAKNTAHVGRCSRCRTCGWRDDS